MTNARVSVPVTLPFCLQLERLKDAAMPMGPTKTVAHFSFPMHCAPAPLLVSVSHFHVGSPTLEIPTVDPFFAGVGVKVEQRVKPSVDVGPIGLICSDRVKLSTRAAARCEIGRELSQYDCDREISS